MDFCPNCGSMILPGREFCSSCGVSKNAKTEDLKAKVDSKPSSDNYSKNDKKLLDEYDFELRVNKEYFDKLNDVELDLQQRLACVVDCDNLQIVAGAGTGKTFTIISKINYLIDKKGINPNEILCMSFTKASVQDLKNKLPSGVKVYTFNGLGRYIASAFSEREILDVFADKPKEFREMFSDYVDSSSEKVKSDIFDLCKEFMTVANKDKLKEFDEFEEKLTFALNNSSFLKFIRQYISLFKSMGYGTNDFKKLKSSSDSDDIWDNFYSMQNNHFLEVFKPIYMHYRGYLDKNHLIDFDDMIIDSIKLVESGKCGLNYKYIFVDEYQDISYANYRLIDALKKQNNAKLVVVGDDWQSIYGFRDSNVKFFANFEQYFENPTKVFIETTYRSSQELIDVAGQFVMKSDNLIKKSLKSNLHDDKPIKIVYCSQNDRKYEYVEKLIKTLSDSSEELLILGRHNNDIDKLIVNTKFKKRGNIVVDKANRIFDKDDKSLDNVLYRTIHSAKGLEADNVIIACANDDYVGFPNKIQTKSYMSIIHDWDDSLKQEEERRLFYVALTRSKNDVYIFTEYNNESKFISELKRMNSNNLEIIEL